MMKRTGVPRLGPDEPPMQQQNPNQYHTKSNEQNLSGFSLFEGLGSNLSNEIQQQPGASNMHTLAQSAQPIIGRAPRASAPAFINYMKPGVQYEPLAIKQSPGQHQPPRIKPSLTPLPLGRQSPAPQSSAVAICNTSAVAICNPSAVAICNPPQQQFQRLKVEDALSYLDQVKYKFNTQPQVYNDFLDIMKEFKSQTIDTPGVITRVSNLFKGHPELIVGFNTFLPPGYKIEVQSNGQVSVSMPSPTGLGGSSGALVPARQTPQLPHVHLLPIQQSANSAIVHNLSVNTAPTNTLHQISQAHQQIEAAAIHHAPGGGGTPPAHAPASAGQPVEFNHAIEYVNKIKSRFSRQPDKYKRFLEILHAYQRGHRDLKEPQAKQQTEQEVYSQVAKLFENQEDLLTEFGQFLPDAKAVTKPPDEPHYSMPTPQNESVVMRRAETPERYVVAPPLAPHAPHHAQSTHQIQIVKHSSTLTSNAPVPPPQHHSLKRSPSFSSSNQLAAGAPPAKKARGSWGSGGAGGGGAGRDVSLAEAGKLATEHDLSFFEKARRALKHHHVYDNFLRCLLLFTNEIISSSELVSVTAPFLCRHPELHKWLQDFVGPTHSPPVTPTPTPTNTIHTGYTSQYTSSEQLFERARSRERERERERERLASHSSTRYEPIGHPRLDRPTDSAPAMDIDLTTCKRLGTSYCALPAEAAARRCSGRTALCKEVLNNTWVSFPTWSEDSTFVTSRKTQYEEYIYRCEDERFELDVVIETNASTIRVLEGVQKKLSRMSGEEAHRFRLDECLGGASPTVHQRALRRIYGDKVAVDIIAGLKKNPVVAVPVVLRRLKAKEEEWREAQKGFNKQWREQNEKYYLKSLDHQGINFKQNDLKAMRSKSLFNEVESAYATRRPGPHLVSDYFMQSRQEAIKIVRDTAELLIHHARRQTGIQKAEKRRIKQLLRHFLPDLFNHPRQPLSDDERDEEEKEDPASPGSAAGEPAPEEKPSVALGQDTKLESSESDNASDKSGKTSKNNKENKPKNNITDNKESNASANTVKRSSSNEDQTSVKSDVKSETADPEDDFKDYPPNEARFVCSMSWYLFLRVHCALCSRLGAARRHAAQLAREKAPSAASALRLKPNNLPASASSPSQYYSALLELVRGVLDGNVEAAAYEDAAREMLGIKAYPAYTLDKLVSIAVRQLQHCVSEPWSVRAAELAARGGMRGGAGYVRRARRYLKQHHAAFLVKVYGGDECKVTFELLEAAGGEGRTSPHNNNDNTRLSPTNQSVGTQNGSAVSRLAAWSLYTERYARAEARAGGAGPGGAAAGGARSKPVFLVRNARARCGGYTHNAHSLPPGPGPQAQPPRARRKPTLRLHDNEECSLTHHYRSRPVAFRELSLYQPGALAAARASHARLHAARRDKFKAWHTRHQVHQRGT